MHKNKDKYVELVGIIEYLQRKVEILGGGEPFMIRQGKGGF